MIKTRMDDCMGYVVECDDDESECSVVLEEDGKVAYAYLLREGDIIGDVWLYNVNGAPGQPEWDDPDNAPFANPREFAGEKARPDLDDPEKEISCEWIRSDGSDAVTAVLVKIKGTAVGRLEPNATPGWSAFAEKDGPLAKVLRN